MESKMYLGVPVEIDEKEVAFNFLISENAYGVNCKLIAAGYSAYIDQDLVRFTGDMPESWIEPATQKLISLLEGA